MGGKRCGHVWKMMSNILSEIHSEKSSELFTNYSIRRNIVFDFFLTRHKPAKVKFYVCFSFFVRSLTLIFAEFRSSCAVNCFHAPLVKGCNKCKTIANHYK